MTARTTTILIGVLALSAAAASALGQTVFFDDFDGNALKPHWAIGPVPGAMEYQVRDSMLVVTKLLYPSDPHTPYNYAWIEAELPVHMEDFITRVRMGWESGSFWGLSFHVRDSAGQQIATMAWAGQSGILTQTRGGPTQFFAAPPPGVHDFEIRRVGTNVDFRLNGTYLTTIPDFGNPAATVLFTFLGDYPDPGQRPLYVDRIHVVPAPAPFMAGALAIALAHTMRRSR